MKTALRKWAWIALGYQGGHMPVTLEDLKRSHAEHMKQIEHKINGLIAQNQQQIERQLAQAMAQQLEFHAAQNESMARTNKVEMIIRLLPQVGTIGNAMSMLSEIEGACK